MKTNCKKLIALSLALVLALSFCACGNISSKVKEIAGKDGGSDKTLWDKSVTAEYVKLPDAAFHDENSYCYGVAPDGVTFLMGDADNAYLYNIDTGKELKLSPAGDATSEILLAAGEQLTSREPENVREKFLNADDSERLGMILNEFGKYIGARFGNYVLPGACLDGNYIMATNTSCNFIMVIDCDNGSYYAVESMAYAVRNGRILSFMRGNSEYFEIDMKSGETERTSMKNAGKSLGMKDGAVISTLNYLPDGSVAAVMRDINVDFENGQECALAVHTESGDNEIYPLGRLKFGWEPDCIISADSRYVIAYSRVYISSRVVYLIDRENGSVSVLYVKNGRLRTSDLKDCLTDGAPVAPDNDDMLLVMDACSDGKTILAYLGIDCKAVLIRPDTLEKQTLAKDVPMPTLWHYSGYDKVWSTWSGEYDKDFRLGYIRFKVS